MSNFSTWQTIGRFLALNPDIREPLLVVAELYRPPEILTFEAASADYEERKELATRFLSTARFGHCPECYSTIVAYADGTFLSWPGLDKHTCPRASSRRTWQPVAQR